MRIKAVRKKRSMRSPIFQIDYFGSRGKNGLAGVRGMEVWDEENKILAVGTLCIRALLQSAQAVSNTFMALWKA